MPKDIRSFFTVLSKKPAPAKKKAPIIVDSDDEDVVKGTPDKIPKVQKKRRVLSSDSEGESEKVKLNTKKSKKESNDNLKPVDLDSLNRVVKQSEIKVQPEESKKESRDKVSKNVSKKKAKKSELGVHRDKKFEATLIDLDTDNDDTLLMDNLDVLDKTIEDLTKESEMMRKSEQVESTRDVTPKKSEKRQRKNSETTPTPKKKIKLEQIDSGIDNEMEKQEKKRRSTGLYLAYLNRGGPKHHGEKDYPKGNPLCLKNLTFLRTGVLDSLEGEEFEKLVTDHGGRSVHSISKKVDYVVVGEEPGPAKLEKAKKYNIPEITEDEFLDLILVKSGKKPKYAAKSELSEDFGIGGSEIADSPKSSIKSEDIFEESEIKEMVHKQEVPLETEKKEVFKVQPIKPEESKLIIPETGTDDNLSWTDKYKPSNLKAVIGQQDSNSNLNKLKKWLENWFLNADPERRKKLARPTQYNQFDGAYFKAALLSGPPGVGKTTTATLVAQELGFDIVEFNASDTRNKKLLQEEISQMMKSKTLAGFASGENNINQKRVLLMDEVDGMAGNEDRGGIAELINFIKSASFPIICMCNNRDSQKMRSLVNHCYALKFGKPNVTQIRGAMMSICFKEGLSIKPDALSQLIIGTGCDIRQTLNNLSMWSAVNKNLSADTVQAESKKSQKDVVIGVWDVIRKVFNSSENKDMSVVDKARLFFYDYSFGPMFVQENYLTTEPDCTGLTNKRPLEKLIRRYLTADCLSQSDLVEANIRRNQNWSLLETQAFLSTVYPSFYLSGKMGQVRFPGWFGRNSQRNKSLRMVSEFYSHSRTCISGDKFSMRLDYAEPLTKRLVAPLISKQSAGIDDTLDIMKSYSLLRDDLTNLCELMSGFKRKNPFDSVGSTVKAALTRKYNKTMMPSFAPPAVSKKKKAQAQDMFGEEDEDEEEDSEESEDVSADALVKAKGSSQGGSSKAGVKKKSESSKGKSGDAKGKAKKR